MLVPVNQSRRVLTRRSVVWLMVLGCLLGTLPTVLTTPAKAESEKKTPVTEKKKPGRIFVRVILKLDETIETENVKKWLDQIIAVDPETGSWETMTGIGQNPSISPDGRRLAFERDGAIWTCDTKGSDDASLIANTKGRPVWSPDGKQFLCSNETRVEMKDAPYGPWHFTTWRFAHDGTGEQIKTEIPSTDTAWDWSSDGKWIITSSLRDRPKGMGWQLYLMRPDGSESRHLTRWGVNFYARFAPDGWQIVYTDSSRSMERIKIVGVDGKNMREVFRAKGVMGLKGACWSPDGKQLAAVVWDWQLTKDGRKTFGASNADPNYRLLIMDANGKNARELRIELDDYRLTWIGHCPDWR